MHASLEEVVMCCTHVVMDRGRVSHIMVSQQSVSMSVLVWVMVQRVIVVNDIDIVVGVMTEEVVLEPFLLSGDRVPWVVMLPVSFWFGPSWHDMLMDILMNNVYMLVIHKVMWHLMGHGNMVVIHKVMWHLMGHGHMVGVMGNWHLRDVVLIMDVGVVRRHLSDIVLVIFMVDDGKGHLSVAVVVAVLTMVQQGVLIVLKRLLIHPQILILPVVSIVSIMVVIIDVPVPLVIAIMRVLVILPMSPLLVILVQEVRPEALAVIDLIEVVHQSVVVVLFIFIETLHDLILFG